MRNPSGYNQATSHTSMNQKPASTAERIRQIFGQWIQPGRHTKLFELWPVDIREELLRVAGIGTGERTIVACYFDHEAWTLLTGERLVWQRAGAQTTLTWPEITDVQVDQHTTASRYPGEGARRSHLHVITHHGRSHELELEPGPPFFGFWTALKMMSRSQR
jgi:hypothetical protein